MGLVKKSDDEELVFLGSILKQGVNILGDVSFNRGTPERYRNSRANGNMSPLLGFNSVFWVNPSRALTHWAESLNLWQVHGSCLSSARLKTAVAHLSRGAGVECVEVVRLEVISQNCLS